MNMNHYKYNQWQLVRYMCISLVNNIIQSIRTVEQKINEPLNISENIRI